MNSKEEFYFTIDKSSYAEFKDRGSRFLAYAYPVTTVEEFKQHLNNLKREHSKAVHHCFAYRLGFDKNNYRVNDDGEPSGSAGKPILNQIDSKQLTNTVVIVVRYFGGTLLGVPGLINAYKSATAMALQTTPIIQKPILVTYQLQFDYTRMNDVMILVRQYNCTVISQQMQLFCLLTMGVPKARTDEVEYRLRELLSVEFKKMG